MKKSLYISNLLALFFSLFLISCSSSQKLTDENLWLEKVEDKAALDWVRQQNKVTFEKFGSDKKFNSFLSQAKDIYSDKDKLLHVAFRGNYAYNFWTDSKKPHGLWRRSLKSRYLKGKPRWTTLLDMGQLRKKENKKWVFKGSECLQKLELCLVSLSNGGKDATEVREFNLKTKSFVLKNTFYIPEGRTSVSWVNKNQILFASTIFKENVTTSGYPSKVYSLNRGQKYTEKKLVLDDKANKRLAGLFIGHLNYKNKRLNMGYHWLNNQRQEYTIFHNSKTIKLPFPPDAELKGVFKDQAVLSFKTDYKLKTGAYITAGSLVSVSMEELLQNKFGKLKIVTHSEKSKIVDSVDVSKNRVFVSFLTDVKSSLSNFNYKNNKWVETKIKTETNGSISLRTSQDPDNQDVTFTYQDYITPATLYHFKDTSLNPKVLQKQKPHFNTKNLEIRQYKAQSRDGELIPYFIVRRKGVKSREATPTLLYGYGGFEISRKPFYSGVWGKLWLERGGQFVVANIRGGGEYGPKWHRSAILENKQRSYDDFIAVAEKLIKDEQTSPKHLGIMGGSNGGLLVGAVSMQRPDLLGAVVCQVPLLDMMRYHKMLVGASWMGEFGNPEDSKMRKVILKYSPYQNIKEKTEYPSILFTTSTKDDRVHPGHARKMHKRLKGMGYTSFLYENIDGGHGGSSGVNDKAKTNALTFNYLGKTLGLKN